jgi:TM2 domain-containing membrane protein YozV
MKYYITIDKKTAGPYTLSQVKALYNSGVIESTFLYATTESHDWLPISTLVPLFDMPESNETPIPSNTHFQQPTIVINNTNNNGNNVGNDGNFSNFSFRKSRTIYQVLALFLGAFGAHNFYAKRNSQAWGQLLITMLTCGYGGIISHIWAIVDIFNVKVDGNNVPMS